MTQLDSLTHVRELLKNHKTADDGEAVSLRRIQELIATAASPFSRQNYIPGHLTASAVVADPTRQFTALIFHGKLKRWLQPGGHFEPGEHDPSLAAAREVSEETGLETRWPGAAALLLDVDVHEIPARKSEPAHFHFDLRMLLIAEKGVLRVGEGTTDARWFDARECAALNLDPGIYRALKKIGFQL